MFYNYNVFYDGKLVKQVRAISEQDAINRVYLRSGGASAYSGNASRLYTAERS